MRSKFKWLAALFIAFTIQLTFAQQKTITGKVSNEEGSVIGAVVKIVGTNNAVTTAMDGGYSIKAKEGDVLEASFIGMATKTMTVGVSNVINFNLVSGQAIAQVVVTSFNIKKRKDALVSATQVVGAKELNQASAPNIIQALTGKVSGLQINSTSAGVNGESRVVLRGPRSITGNNEALVVIDGAISTLGVLNQLPPDAVESLTVLKGQQGGVLYGDQGSNGVIVVSTKKGNKGGKLKVNFNSAVDVQSIAFTPQVQTKYGQGWYGYDLDFPNATDPRNNSEYFSYYENGSWGEPFDTGAFAGTVVPVGLQQPDGSFITDVYKSRGSNNFRDFYNTGIILQNNITLNAGDENGYVLFGAGRLTGDFVVEGDKLKRNSFNFKAGKKIGKFSINTDLNYINSITSQTDNDLLGELIQTPTNVNINRFRNSGHSGHWTVFAKNPFTLIEQERNDDSSDLFIANLNLGYEISKNITLNYTGNIRGNYNISESHNDGAKVTGYQYDLTNAPYVDNDHGTAPVYADYGGSDITSNYLITQSFNRTLYNDLVTNMNFDLTSETNLKAKLGFVVQEQKFRIQRQGGDNIDVPGVYNMTNILLPYSASQVAGSNRQSLTRTYGAFANTDFSYKDFFFVNGGFRYDRRSTVNKGQNFYSLGASFVPTKAFDVLKDSFMNYAKISASYTKVGNSSPVAAYATASVTNVADGFPFGGLVGYNPNRSPTNEFIEPEYVTTKEFGINLGFLKDRITLDASVYNTLTTKMITNAIVSNTTGYQSFRDNTGTLENNGFEIDLGITPIKNSNGFEWNLRANYSTYSSKIKELSEGVNQINLQLLNRDGLAIAAEVGEEFPLIKGTAFVRNPDGNIIVDANGNPTKTSNFVKLGKANPDYIIGLSNTFSYKGFALSAVADFRTGNVVYSETYRNLQFTGAAIESAEQDRFAGYVVPGSVQLIGGQYVPNTVPAGSQSSVHGLNGQVNDFFNNVMRQTGETNIIDGTTLKIREIALSYSLPSNLIKKAGFDSVKLSINARNPFTFFFTRGEAGKFYDGGIYGKKNLGYTDPEANNTANTGANSNAIGISEVGQYPTLRTLGFSLNLTF